MLNKLIMFDTTKAHRERADTASTASCESFAQNEMQICIDDQESLQQAWTELKCGAYAHASKIEVNFHPTDAYRKLSKLRHLNEFFNALGDLKHLEELVFTDSDLLITSVCKLLKKSSLKSLKFLQCTFIAKKLQQTDKVWNVLATHDQLTCLEILDCKYTDSETLCRNRIDLTYDIPSFLHKSTTLRRLVLDNVRLANSNDVAALLNNTSLQEIEIRPTWVVSSSVPRRQQYQAKMLFIREILTETVPNCLCYNTTLSKLIIGLEDYQLEQVFVETMTCWMDLVQFDNSTLRDLRLTHQPLGAEEWRALEEGESPANCLIHHLQSILRLNQIFTKRLTQAPAPACSMAGPTENEAEEWEVGSHEEEASSPIQSDTNESDPTEVWV